jgi:predicted O-methyltransferase YrrM
MGLDTIPAGPMKAVSGQQTIKSRKKAAIGKFPSSGVPVDRRSQMSKFAALGRRLAMPLLKVSRFDLRLARLRLREFGVPHAELSAVLSPCDSSGSPNERLMNLLLALITRTRHISLSGLSERNPPQFLHWWPGDHYRLLAALVQELNPQTVLEIGTFKGLSALAMLCYLPPNAQLTSFDIVPWQKIPGTFLRPPDFASGNFRQIVCDLQDPENCRAHAALLQSAELIFIDGPKDGVFEDRLLDNFTSIGLRPHTLLVFDDIRIWNMLETWLRIQCPKLDVTSIGHYTGTGLVDWVPQQP